MDAFLSESDSTADPGQAGLARVAYLGGMLLPFSVVAGILSMDAPFGPGNKFFWVFWAASIPLTVITLLAIYADDIRRLEVWVEVAADSLQEAIDVNDSIHVGADASSLKVSMDEVSARPKTEAGRPHKPDDRRATKVCVATGKSRHGRKSLSYHELSEVAEPDKTAESAAAAAPVEEGHAETGSTHVVVEDDVQEIVIEVVSARRRRRFRIIDPLGGGSGRPSAEEPPPAGLDAADAGETVLVDMRGHSRSPGHRTSRLRHSTPPGLVPPYLGRGRRVPHSSRPPALPSYVLERPVDGSQPKAWRRQQLGWLGAARTMAGYRKPHRVQDIPVGSAAVEQKQLGAGTGIGVRSRMG